MFIEDGEHRELGEVVMPKNGRVLDYSFDDPFMNLAMEVI